MAKRRITSGRGFSGPQGSGMKICNIERGLPTVGQAHKRIEEEIAAAKFGKWTCMKLIHGYGSSGRGGMIKNSLPSFLDAADAARAISGTISGAKIFRSSIPVPSGRFCAIRISQGMRTWNSAITVLRLFCCRIIFQSGKRSDGLP